MVKKLLKKVKAIILVFINGNMIIEIPLTCAPSLAHEEELEERRAHEPLCESSGNENLTVKLSKF